MQDKLKKFESLLGDALSYTQRADESDLRFRTSVNSWSKKEVMGHLVDSSFYHLQVLNEIQYAEKPYLLRDYSPQKLVKANDYQNWEITDISIFLICLNNQIVGTISRLSTDVFKSSVTINGEMFDLMFLIDEYLKQFEYYVEGLVSTRSAP